jgi:predicted nuclease with TOPRIM domain
MSSDRTTEILNYLSAISREMGEFRAEVNVRFSEVNARLDRIERELRVLTRRLDRVEGAVLKIGADVDELDERVEALEGKRT